MSHIIYKDKIFLKLSEKRLFALVSTSDSNVWNADNKSHPYEWSPIVVNINGNRYVHNIEDFNEMTKKFLEDSMKRAQSFEDAEHTGKTITLNSYTYFGDSYRGGRRYRDQKSFFSTRNLWDLNEFLAIAGYFEIQFYCFENGKYTYGPAITIKTEADILEADRIYRETLDKNGKKLYSSIIKYLRTNKPYKQKNRKETHTYA